MIIRTDSLTAGYNMIPSGTTLTDQSINEYDGTITAATYLRTLYGDALDFNGTSAWVITSNGPFANTSHTIAFWAYPRDDTSSQYLVSNGSVSGTNRVNIFILSGNLSYFYGSGGGSKSVSAAITADAWHHIAITRDFDGANTTAKLYIDGVNVDSDVSAVTPGINDTDLILGNRTGLSSDWFDGSMVDPQIHDEAKDSTWVVTEFESKTIETQKNVDRILSQFAAASNLEGLVEIYSTQLNELNEILVYLRDNTTLNASYTVWLDIIGDIIGIIRPNRQNPYATMFAFKGEETDIDDPFKGFCSSLPV